MEFAAKHQPGGHEIRGLAYPWLRDVEGVALEQVLMASGEVAPASRASLPVPASPDKLARGSPLHSTPLRRRNRARPAISARRIAPHPPAVKAVPNMPSDHPRWVDRSARAVGAAHFGQSRRAAASHRGQGRADISALF